MTKVKIAGLTVKLEISDLLISDDILKYQTSDTNKEDVTITINNGRIPQFPELGGKPPLLHCVHIIDDQKYYLYSNDDYISYIKYNQNYTHFTIYTNEKITSYENSTPAISSTLKRIFIMLITKKDGVFIHAATIGFRGEALCFSAASGTGKTTHTNLWRDYIPEIKILNGDTGVLVIQENEVRFYSTPWCGSSGENINTEAQVKAVVFLEQANTNQIISIKPAEIFMRLLTGCFLPVWDKELNLQAVDTIETLSGLLDCYLLKCQRNEEAVRICYHEIFNQR